MAIVFVAPCDEVITEAHPSCNTVHWLVPYLVHHSLGLFCWPHTRNLF